MPGRDDALCKYFVCLQSITCGATDALKASSSLQAVMLRL